jgi:hypothetical protein
VGKNGKSLPRTKFGADHSSMEIPAILLDKDYTRRGYFSGFIIASCSWRHDIGLAFASNFPDISHGVI